MIRWSRSDLESMTPIISQFHISWFRHSYCKVFRHSNFRYPKPRNGVGSTVHIKPWSDDLDDFVISAFLWYCFLTLQVAIRETTKWSLWHALIFCHASLLDQQSRFYRGFTTPRAFVVPDQWFRSVLDLMVRINSRFRISRFRDVREPCSFDSPVNEMTIFRHVSYGPNGADIVMISHIVISGLPW
jgi:hypothetical protein